MPRNYLLFIDEGQRVKVEIWPTRNSDGTANYDFPKTVTVASRSHPGAVWGPPIELLEEK